MRFDASIGDISDGKSGGTIQSGDLLQNGSLTGDLQMAASTALWESGDGSMKGNIVLAHHMEGGEMRSKTSTFTLDTTEIPENPFAKNKEGGDGTVLSTEARRMTERSGVEGISGKRDRFNSLISQSDMKLEAAEIAFNNGFYKSGLHDTIVQQMTELKLASYGVNGRFAELSKPKREEYGKKISEAIAAGSTDPAAIKNLAGQIRGAGYGELADSLENFDVKLKQIQPTFAKANEVRKPLREAVSDSVNTRIEFMKAMQSASKSEQLNAGDRGLDERKTLLLGRQVRHLREDFQRELNISRSSYELPLKLW